MSLEDLKADLATNMKEASVMSAGVMANPADLLRHLQNTLWPFLENLVGELEEIDDTVDDMYHSAEDILQPETAQLFATVIAGGMALVNELEKRLTMPADAQIIAGIREWRRLAGESAQTIAEITVMPQADANQGDDQDDDDDDDDEDDDEETDQPEQP